MDELDVAFDAVLESVAAFVPRSKNEAELTAFHALRGPAWRNELMVVGRAVNGWGEEGWAPSDAADGEWRRVRTSVMRKMTFWELANQSGEIENHWGPGYNPRTSAFWRVIRGVSIQIMQAENSRWTERLVWSNLYKIAPSEGGNPSKKLCELQEAAAIKLMAEELRVYRPRRLLLLTGNSWAGSFISAFHGTSRAKPTGHVEWIGSLEGHEGGRRVSVVVVPHPQGLRGGESALVAEIVGAFEKLSSG